MDLVALLRLTVRRWIVVVPILLLTFLALVLLVVRSGHDHEMRGSYLLVAGETLDRPDSGLDPETAAESLSDLLQHPSVRRTLDSEGLSTDYGVTISQTGTRLRLAVNGDSPEIVTRTAERLIEMAPELLRQSIGEDAAATVDTRALTVPDIDDVVSTDERDSIAVSIVVSSVAPESGNPFPATLATVHSLIEIALAVDFEDHVAEVVPGAEYDVGSVVREAPIINVTVTASSSEGAAAAYELVRDQLVAGLTRLQDENFVGSQYRTILRAIVEPAAPVSTPAPKVRPAAGIVVAGTGLAVALAVLAESLAVARRNRLANGRPSGPETNDSDDNDQASVGDEDAIVPVVAAADSDSRSPADGDGGTRGRTGGIQLAVAAPSGNGSDAGSTTSRDDRVSAGRGGSEGKEPAGGNEADGEAPKSRRPARRRAVKSSPGRDGDAARESDVASSAPTRRTSALRPPARPR